VFVGFKGHAQLWKSQFECRDLAQELLAQGAAAATYPLRPSHLLLC
jgi:hypothetical protein